VQPLRSVHAALAPSPGRPDVGHVQVDAERPHPGPPRDPQAPFGILGPHAAGQAVARVVGDLDRLGLGVVRDHRHHRPVDLVPGDGHPGVGVREHGGPVVVAAHRGGRAAPAGHDPRPRHHAGRHAGLHQHPLPRIGQRPHGRLLGHRVAHREPAGLGDQRGHRLVVPAPRGQHPGHGEARLPGVGEAQAAQLGRDRAQVDVVEHDRGRLAAQFEGDRLEALAADRGDPPPGRGRPGDRHDVHAGVRREHLRHRRGPDPADGRADRGRARRERGEGRRRRARAHGAPPARPGTAGLQAEPARAQAPEGRRHARHHRRAHPGR
jgi:hypothetical protein